MSKLSAGSSSFAPPATPSAVIGGNTGTASSASSTSGGSTPQHPSSSAPPRLNMPPKRGQHHKSSKRNVSYPDSEAHAEYSLTNGSTTSRKGQVSISHLLNFTLPPRQSPQVYTNRARQTGRKAPAFGLGSGYHPSDKLRFVNANYRFVVQPDLDYRAQCVDPDVHVRWEDIMQVLAATQTQKTNCPICLTELPIAPRMAKCGHIFCYPCLLRYLGSEDGRATKGKWKSCPICWDSVYPSEVKPLKWYDGQVSELPREGGDILLRLVMRRQGSTLALPRDGADNPLKQDELPWHFAAEVFDYARMMRGTEEYMLGEYKREVEELQTMAYEDELLFGEDGHWTEKAVRKIQEEVLRDGELPPVERPPAELDSRTPRSGTPSSSRGKSLSTNRDRDHSETPFYFYQARNASHFYLSPLDIRILKASFGSYAIFPSTLLAQIERISHGHVVDDELRKRVRYLAHLPAGCEVAFLECDWSEIVRPDVLEPFVGEIVRRRKRRADKDKREERERVRAEKDDSKIWATARRQASPPAETDFMALPTPSPSSPAEPSMMGSLPSNASLPSTPPASQGTGQRTVWGTRAVASTAADQPLLVEEEMNERDSGWLDGWEEDLLDAQVSATVPTPGKKSKKKVVLMQTGGRRGA